MAASRSPGLSWYSRDQKLAWDRRSCVSMESRKSRVAGWNASVPSVSAISFSAGVISTPAHAPSPADSKKDSIRREARMEDSKRAGRRPVEERVAPYSASPRQEFLNVREETRLRGRYVSRNGTP